MDAERSDFSWWSWAFHLALPPVTCAIVFFGSLATRDLLVSAPFPLGLLMPMSIGVLPIALSVAVAMFVAARLSRGLRLIFLTIIVIETLIAFCVWAELWRRFVTSWR